MSAPLIIRGIALLGGLVFGGLLAYFTYQSITERPQENEPEPQCRPRSRSPRNATNKRNRCMKCLRETPNPRNREFLKCGHVLHKDCFQELVLGGERSCPECRSRISQSEIDEILGKTDNKNSCAICLEQINFHDIKILNCNHNFHEDCINDMVSSGCEKCPSCRKFISEAEMGEIKLRMRRRQAIKM